MKLIIEITEREIKDLKLIRNYFGEHDKTHLEHLAYSELDKLINKLKLADIADFFSEKDMENFAAKMLLTFDKSRTLKDELKLFCEKDLNR